MNIQILDPNEIPEWDALLLRSNDHSFFHSSAWATVLSSTYRFKPTYFAMIENGQLFFLMPFMEIRSVLTGKRGVSLPFSDECVPYFREKGLVEQAIQQAISHGKQSKWKYVEWRHSGYFDEAQPPSELFYTHDIDLSKPESELFACLRSNNQRNIRKAIKEGVSIRISTSKGSLRPFYRLNCITRKRHGIPPQPFAFFTNIYDHVISSGFGVIVSAIYSGKVIAAAVFFHFGTRAIFKYGASEMNHQHLRPNNLMLWETIKWYRDTGYASLNLGRTELENAGLLRFKRSWGARERDLKYYRYSIRNAEFTRGTPKPHHLPLWLFARTPRVVLRLIGSLAYRHIG